jgi:hypothetical protein
MARSSSSETRPFEDKGQVEIVEIAGHMVRASLGETTIGALAHTCLRTGCKGRQDLGRDSI